MMIIVLDWGFVCVTLCLFYVFWEEIKVHYVGLSLAFPLGGEGGCKEPKSMPRSCGE